MRRIAFFAYGLVAYVMFLVTFAYAAGFVGNVVVPRTIDGTPEVPLGKAILINLGLLTVFAVQHSVMARPAFKRWWTRFVPKVIERSTYVLASNLALIVLFVFWEPMGGVIWNLENGVARGVMIAICATGWLTIVGSTFLLNHFELFGLQQVWFYLRGGESQPPKFRTPLLYKRVRHPIYLGFVLAFWATPTMTVTHLIFAVATLGYILVAIQLEERDLVAVHGETYTAYQKKVPMLFPMFGKKVSSGSIPAPSEVAMERSA